MTAEIIVLFSRYWKFTCEEKKSDSNNSFSELLKLKVFQITTFNITELLMKLHN